MNTISMNKGEFRKEHKDLANLLHSTANVLNKEALAQTREARMRLGKGVKTRGNRVVRRRGNVMGSGIFGDVFEDLAVEGAKKLYKFDKEHGSHLKEGVKQGFKGMISNIFKGGNGLKEELEKIKMKNRIPNMNDNMIRPAVMPEGWDRKQPDYTNDISGWIEKERRSTGYYDRHPVILGEGM